jgi:hypothetical protein
MSRTATTYEAQVIRQVFESWSIAIPMTFSEDFLSEDGYWHAWDRRRSVSLTSIVLMERDRPVTAREVLECIPRQDGEPVAELPPGLEGWASFLEVEQPARAGRALSGMLATDGRVLLATITADDLDWARAIWMSIRHTAPVLAAAPLGRSERRRAERQRACH